MGSHTKHTKFEITVSAIVILLAIMLVDILDIDNLVRRGVSN